MFERENQEETMTPDCVPICDFMRRERQLESAAASYQSSYENLADAAEKLLSRVLSKAEIENWIEGCLEGGDEIELSNAFDLAVSWLEDEIEYEGLEPDGETRRAMMAWKATYESQDPDHPGTERLKLALFGPSEDDLELETLRALEVLSTPSLQALENSDMSLQSFARYLLRERARKARVPGQGQLSRK